MALRCITSAISSDECSAKYGESHGLSDSEGVDGGDGAFKQLNWMPIAPHKLFDGSHEMAMRCWMRKSQIIPEPDSASRRSVSYGCHEMLLSVMLRGPVVIRFWNGDTMRLIECVSTSAASSNDEQWKSSRCTYGESRCNVTNVELRVTHQLKSLIFFSVGCVEIGFSKCRTSHRVMTLSMKLAINRPFGAIETPWTARVLAILTVGVLWRKSIIFKYLWLIPANKLRAFFSQHNECAVSDRPIRCNVAFSFDTPRSVSQTVMQWSERLRSWPIASSRVSVSCQARHTHGRDCFGATKQCTHYATDSVWWQIHHKALTELNVILVRWHEIAKSHLSIGQTNGQLQFTGTTIRRRHTANVLVSRFRCKQCGRCCVRNVQIDI